MLFVVGMGSSVVTAAWVGRNLWFFSDDWNIVTQYPSGNLLRPFNGHLSAVPIGLYQLLFHTVGLSSYLPYRVLGLLMLIALAVAVFRYARSQVGTPGAAAAATLTVWGSAGMSNVLFPFLMNFSLPIAGLCVMWSAIDSRDRWADRRLGVAALVCVATSGIGVVVVGAVLVDLAWRRAPLRSWLAVAPSVLLWSVWYAWKHEPLPGAGGLRPIVSYSVRMLFGGFKALGGGSGIGGWIVLVLFLALAAHARPAALLHDARTVSALSAPVAFSLVTAISRIGVVPAIPPDELRYRWTLAAMLILLAIRMFRIAPRLMIHRRAQQMVVICLAGIFAVNVQTLLSEMDGWVERASLTKGPIAAALWETEATTGLGHELNDRTLPVSFVRVTSGDYRHTITEIGSALTDHAGSAHRGNSPQHLEADTALLAESGLRSERTSGLSGCTPIVADSTSALSFPPDATVRLTSGTEDVSLRIGVLSDGVPFRTLSAATTGYLRFPRLNTAVHHYAYRIVPQPGLEVSRCS